MLNFDEAKAGAKFGDIFFDTFTTLEKQFGQEELIQRELKDGGKDIAVTMGNRQEYVDLLVDYKLRKQCVTQLTALKKGFGRIVEAKMIKSLLDSAELEEAICGQKKLDLSELRYSAKYCQGFSPECEMMNWFWEQEKLPKKLTVVKVKSIF